MSSDLTTDILTLSGHTDNVACLKILPDGRLASGSLDNSVRIWNLSTGYADFILYEHIDQIYSLDVLSNGYLVSVGVDSAIRVWNITTGTLFQSITDVHFGSINIVKTINQNYFATGGTDSLVKVLQ
jgi:WD40 repeat protein